jgi:hypothetical protein
MRRFFLGVFLVLAFSSFVLADSGEDYNKSLVCLAESTTTLNSMVDAGFNVQRVNDTLRQANGMFEAQNALKDSGRQGNFSLVIEYCSEISQISRSAFQARDELSALQRFYEESLSKEMNTSIIDATIAEIEGEIRSERYEKVTPLVDEGYTQIINIKSENTALNLVYQTTSKTIKSFFYNNWKYLSVGLGALLFLFLLFKNTLSQWWIRRQIDSLESRKDTLKDLIRQTQKDYFEGGKISEATYTIRIKKFGELIRDIDRQIPLLQEQLIKVLRRQNKSVSSAEVRRRR